MRLTRPIALVLAIAFVAVAAVVLALSQRDGRDTAASPSPVVGATVAPVISPTSAGTASPAATITAIPSPTASPRTSVLDQRYGLYFFGGAAGPGTARDAVIRRETSDAVVGSFVANDLRSFISLSRSVSPDGRLVAYWSPDQDGAVLRVRAVRDGSTRAVFTATTGMTAGNFAWSSDGSGLVVAVDNDMSGPVAPGRPLAEIWTVDLASGASTRIASRAEGLEWLPVAWDRGAKIIGAGVSGEGGGLFEFDVFDLSKEPPTRRSYPTIRVGVFAFAMRASPDARYVLTAQSDQPISWWPVADPSKRSTVEYDGVRAEWRPGTSELWWVGRLTPAGCPPGPCTGTELVSFDVATGRRTVVARGTFGAYLVGFRVDGSAAITASFTSDGSRATDLTFVDLATGRAETLRLGGLGVTLGEAGPDLRGSVRLD